MGLELGSSLDIVQQEQVEELLGPHGLLGGGPGPAASQQGGQARVWGRVRKGNARVVLDNDN